MDTTLIISIISVVFTVVGAIATIITVIKANNKVKADNIEAILKEAKERTRFETQTELALKNNSDNIEEMKADIKKLKTDTAELKTDTAELKVRVAFLEQDVKGIKATLEEIKDKIFNIDKIKNMAYKNSPSKLTEIGQKIYDDIVGDDFFNKHKERFIKMIEERQPPTALDVEHLALSVVYQSTSDPIFYGIKNKVYNYPDLKEKDGTPFTVEMDAVCTAISIPLRDEYIRRHPEVLSAE